MWTYEIWNFCRVLGIQNNFHSMSNYHNDY
jgi:hypothetical protein